jgi:hypothetical protein
LFIKSNSIQYIPDVRLNVHTFIRFFRHHRHCFIYIYIYIAVQCSAVFDDRIASPLVSDFISDHHGQHWRPIFGRFRSIGLVFCTPLTKGSPITTKWPVGKVSPINYMGYGLNPKSNTKPILTQLNPTHLPPTFTIIYKVSDISLSQK